MTDTIDWKGGFEEIPDDPAGGGTARAQESDWPTLNTDAFYGLAGEMVSLTLPDTESDPAALLLQYLVSFGNAIGRGPHCVVEQDRHYTNLYIVLAGQTSKARKGTSARRVRVIYEIVDPTWARERIVGGMSSGEGLIHAVRDPVYGMRKGVEELIDAGVSDKRLLLDEREFFQALTVLKREGNTLSRVVREAWDCCELLATLTKHSPTRATQPFISIVGHITIDELRQILDHTSMANGYANRYLFTCVRRSKLLPFGGTQNRDVVELLGRRTREALTAARNIGQVGMTEAATRRWTGIYTALAVGAPGLLGEITNRAEAQVIRLALIYALLDRARQIDVVHLDAALAVWRFCEASARHIFGDTQGNPTADTILRALRAAGANGLMRTDIVNLFGRNLAASKIDAALLVLLNNSKVRCISQKKPTGGRSIETWFAS